MIVDNRVGAAQGDLVVEYSHDVADGVLKHLARSVSFVDCPDLALPFLQHFVSCGNERHRALLVFHRGDAFVSGESTLYGLHGLSLAQLAVLNRFVRQSLITRLELERSFKLHRRDSLRIYAGLQRAYMAHFLGGQTTV